VSASEERWDETEAVLLLKRAGKLVKGLEASGAQMPQSNREQYHTRLVAAHNARDMAAYRIALEGYVEGARKAYRKAKGRRGNRADG
jgi:hypothetical protein